MRKFTPVQAMLALAVVGCGTNATGVFRAADNTTGGLVDGQAIPGEFIVQAKPGRVPTIKRGKVVSTLDLGRQGRFYLVRAENLSGASLKNALASDPAVVSVGPNRHFEVPVFAPAPKLPAIVLPQSEDPLYGQQWYLPHIGADRAWTVTRGTGVVTAVVDTGVDYNHPDLKPAWLGRATRSSTKNRMPSMSSAMVPTWPVSSPRRRTTARADGESHPRRRSCRSAFWRPTEGEASLPSPRASSMRPITGQPTMSMSSST